MRLVERGERAEMVVREDERSRELLPSHASASLTSDWFCGVPDGVSLGR
jgi:hypothetical protein